MKWSSVCAEQAQGVKPGDPTFTAWVRLAATPVRDVKAIVNPRPAYDERGGRGGRGRGGRAAAVAARAAAATAAAAAAVAVAAAATTGGGGAGRGDVEQHGRDGAFSRACASSASSSSRTRCASNEKAHEEGGRAPATSTHPRCGSAEPPRQEL